MSNQLICEKRVIFSKIVGSVRNYFECHLSKLVLIIVALFVKRKVGIKM